MKQKIFLFLIAISFIVGLIGLYRYLTIGHSLLNLNSAVPWGLWVAVYIWFVGISAGNYFIVMFWNIIKNKKLSNLTTISAILSLSTLSAGLLSILLDLGHIERFYKLFISVNFSSVMGWMGFFYSIFTFILLVTLVLSFIKKDVTTKFYVAGIVISSLVILVESMLFARPPGKHWHSIIFPIHFFVTSILSGTGILMFIAGLLKKDNTSLISKTLLVLLIVNLVVEIIDIVSMGTISNLKIIYLLTANLIPIILLILNIHTLKTFVGLFCGIGVLATKYDSLITAQLKQPFKGFENAFFEPGLAFSYIPSFTEWLVTIFLISFSVTFFYVFYKSITSLSSKLVR